MYKRRTIKTDILKDLYGTHLDNLSEAKKVFLKKNLKLEYEPYTEYINKIPEHLLNESYDYRVKISYEPIPPFPGSKYVQIWTLYLEDSTQKTPVATKGPFSIHPSLYAEVMVIIQKEQEISKETEEMSNFIRESFRISTGSKKLRELWPESLHKYLPDNDSYKKKKSTHPDAKYYE